MNYWMSNTILISDTSALIILKKINALELLPQLFSEVIITKVVEIEFGDTLPVWVKVEEVEPTSSMIALMEQLDRGEATVIALGEQKLNATLLIDERKGRTIAKERGLKVIGSLGILLLAKERQVISQVKPYLLKMILTNFRISKGLLNKALALAKELES